MAAAESILTVKIADAPEVVAAIRECEATVNAMHAERVILRAIIHSLSAPLERCADLLGAEEMERIRGLIDAALAPRPAPTEDTTDASEADAG